jgi:nucleoid DNA-binding protein
MRKHQRWACGALTATLGAVLIVAAPAHSQRPPALVPLPQVVARKTKLEEDDVAKVLDATGPAIRDKLSNGEVVELPGLGKFRVVRIPEHKNMIKGRPATIEASNYVEFVPTAQLVEASNSPNAVPALTVPQFEFNPLPDQTPGQRMGGTRMPNTRTP